MFLRTVGILFKGQIVMTRFVSAKDNGKFFPKRADFTVCEAERRNPGSKFRPMAWIWDLRSARPIRSRFLLEFWIRAVAVFAVLGGGFIEKYLLAFKIPE